MQTDVLASIPVTTTGPFKAQNSNNIGRCRIKSVYIVPGTLAGSLVITDGSGGATVATINTVASVSQPTYLLMPGEGILVQNSPYATVSNLGSATIFYG